MWQLREQARVRPALPLLSQPEPQLRLRFPYGSTRGSFGSDHEDKMAPGGGLRADAAARVALDLGVQPKGWLTMSREGIDFLISDTPVAPVAGAPLLSPSQRGRAEMSARASSPRNANESIAVKMKLHFFSFQTDRTPVNLTRSPAADEGLW